MQDQPGGNASVQPESSKFPLLAKIGAIASLCGLLIFVALGGWIVLHPSYNEALKFAQQSPAVADILGAELVAKVGARGTERTRGSTGYAHLRIPVRGTLGDGVLYATLRLVDGKWKASDFAVQAGSDHPTIVRSGVQDETEQPAPGRGTVYLLPLGDLDTGGLRLLAEQISTRFKIRIEVLPAQAIDFSDLLPGRRQVVAENVLKSIRRSHPELVDDYNAHLLAVTDKDLYLREYAWRYGWDFGFAFRHGRFGVVSTARLDASSLLDIRAPFFTNVRLRKMLTKNIGAMYFQLPLSDNSSSVMYGGIQSAADIDFMTEGFTGASKSW
jgi:predicted Zn-dependent protease